MFYKVTEIKIDDPDVHGSVWVVPISWQPHGVGAKFFSAIESSGINVLEQENVDEATQTKATIALMEALEPLLPKLVATWRIEWIDPFAGFDENGNRYDELEPQTITDRPAVFQKPTADEVTNFAKRLPMQIFMDIVGAINDSVAPEEGGSTIPLPNASK